MVFVLINGSFVSSSFFQPDLQEFMPCQTCFWPLVLASRKLQRNFDFGNLIFDDSQPYLLQIIDVVFQFAMKVLTLVEKLGTTMRLTQLVDPLQTLPSLNWRYSLSSPEI